MLELLDHRGVLVEDTVFVWSGTPGRAYPPGGQKVLRSPGDAVQRAPVAARGDFRVRPASLLQGQLLGQGDDALQTRAVGFQSLQVKPGELGGGDLPGADKRS